MDFQLNTDETSETNCSELFIVFVNTQSHSAITFTTAIIVGEPIKTKKENNIVKITESQPVNDHRRKTI